MDHDPCSSSCSTYTSDSSFYSTALPSDASGYETLPALVQHLENEIGINIHFDVDLSIFAQEVWGLDKEAVEKVLAMPITLHESEAEAFKLGEASADDSVQRAFLAISSRLLSEAAKELGDEENGSFTDTFWTRDRLRQNPASRPRRSVPDVVNTRKPFPSDGSALNPSVAKGIVELKRMPPSEKKVQEMEAHGEENSVEESGDCVEFKPVPHRTNDTSLQHSQGRTSPQQTHDRLMLKRSLDSTEDADNEEGRPAKKQRCIEQPALSDSLLPLYATNAMASSSRYYVVGLVVDRFTVTVCYFDRFLVACAAPFSFKENPSKLALTLYTMTRCDFLHAGFDPHLRTLTGRKDDPESTRPIEYVIGSVFEYPDTSSPGICFKDIGVIRRPDELIGRATAVYKVQPRLPDGTFSEEEFAYKLSWPLRSCISEIDVVKRLKARLPKEAQDHLPEFTFTRTFSAEELNLPWLRLGLNLNPSNYNDRVLRGMVGKFYHKLWEAGSIENFKQVWLDCVECLYLARKLGKVLHRDLSEGNLMVLKLADGRIRGVLNDWDMAQFVDAGDSNMEPGSEPRIGTPAFMAHDHLRMQRVPHYFRHDLESLFYILIWAALHYNLKEGTRDRRPHPLVARWIGNRDENRSSKLFLLMYDTDLVEEASATVKPEFAGVLTEWIGPLQFLFAGASLNHYKRLRTDPNAVSNPATWSGDLTFKKFMAAINVTPRTWGIPNFLDGADEF